MRQRVCVRVLRVLGRPSVKSRVTSHVRNLQRKSICLAGCHAGGEMPAGAVPAARVRREDRLQAGQEGLLQAVPGNDSS